MLQLSSSSSQHNTEEVDITVKLTEEHVNWDALSTVACKLYQVSSASWGEKVSGGYSLVRFLHLDNQNKTIIVARVPLRPAEALTPEQVDAQCNCKSSEVATMESIEAYTHIPIPSVIHYNVEVDGGGVGSPYILMSKVEGVPLSSLCDTMDDDKRDIVLSQVVNIMLQLLSLRFDKIGAFSKQEGIGKDACSSNEYWLDIANAHLKNIADDHFGIPNKEFNYAKAWFMRSLVPAIFDSSLDATGFPLEPGDFHSQNIMITGADSPDPHITAVIDWEFSATAPTSSLAQYPLFIVDHPMWPDDDPLRKRNVQDQAKFDELLSAAERDVGPGGNLLLSRAFANCLGPYLLQQCLSDDLMYNELFPQLSAYVFGKDDGEVGMLFFGTHHEALMRKGMLRKEAEQFDYEEKVRRDALATLGEELVRLGLSRADFKALVLEHEDRFAVDGIVREWLASNDAK